MRVDDFIEWAAGVLLLACLVMLLMMVVAMVFLIFHIAFTGGWC